MATGFNQSAIDSSTIAIGTGDAIGEINKYDFRTDSPAVFKARRGIDADIVSQISEMKREPAWMRDFRLKSLEIFNSKPMPHWGGDIGVDFADGEAIAVGGGAIASGDEAAGLLDAIKCRAVNN